MALEIERRFLIKNDNWKEFINKKISINLKKTNLMQKKQNQFLDIQFCIYF